MQLGWNEIQKRAIKFSKKWSEETRERAEKDTFWNEFFNVFGISRRRVATFEMPVKKLGNKRGYIDLFWKGKLLVEHKSRGKDLDKAFNQAIDYFDGLDEHELPKFVLVTDFERMRLYDLETNRDFQFNITELHKYVKLFSFMTGANAYNYNEEDPVNLKAGRIMGELHNKLREAGYTGHALEVYLTRLLFCMFAEDSGIFEPNIFLELITEETSEDGKDLGAILAQLFQVLNTPIDKRLKSLDYMFDRFPFVNGGLFEEWLPITSFDASMRSLLIKACMLDWSKISPAIFGSLFQSVMDQTERHQKGAHYTSERNILKVLNPLFLDELWSEFEQVKDSPRKLREFHKKIANIKILDSACGSGNFLIIAYRELRKLELEILSQLYTKTDSFLDVSLIQQVTINNFYGIEYDEWAAKIAETGMWLIEHQMNIELSERFGQYIVNLPLSTAANITVGNALRIDWNDIIDKGELNYIVGNPPFIAYSSRNTSQNQDMKLIWEETKNAMNLDYVSCWFKKASEYIRDTKIKVAFVSTNSLLQGRQLSVMSKMLEKNGIIFHFAYPSFRWHNDASDKAKVHVIIVGFSNYDIKNKIIFRNTSKSIVESIGYNLQFKNYLVNKRSKPLSFKRKMHFGSIILDNGILSKFTTDEKKEFIEKEPLSKKYFRRIYGSKELLYNIERWCLYLKDIDPAELKVMPYVQILLEEVKQFRSKCKSETTRKFAKYPTMFISDRVYNTINKNNYLAFPRVSSEKRSYIPIKFLNYNEIITCANFMLPGADLIDFAFLTSRMHNVWTKAICGRLKSDIRYSNTIVYNNFILPDLNETQSRRLEQLAQNILDIRDKYPDCCLADLYGDLMPPDLLKAHEELDRYVEKCYRKKKFKDDTDRMNYLYDLYLEKIKQLET